MGEMHQVPGYPGFADYERKRVRTIVVVTLELL